MISFQTDIVIKGKKAEKYQELKSKYGFDLVDIYMMSGVLGFINSSKDVQENDSTITANLPRTVLNNRSSKIDFLLEIITLSEELDVDADNAIKLAFEDSSLENQKKMYKKELFDDYALGGIDILYNMLSDVTYDKQVENIKEIIEKFFENSNINQKTVDEIFEEEGL
ncbi:MAG: hypothetical protein PHN42_05150 [Bacilli bacterium]|nr:hypothetical protein [Bacilli bacterium]